MLSLFVHVGIKVTLIAEKYINRVRGDHYRHSPYVPYRTILTGDWTVGSCVTQQCDVGLSISLLAL